MKWLAFGISGLLIITAVVMLLTSVDSASGNLPLPVLLSILTGVCGLAGVCICATATAPFRDDIQHALYATTTLAAFAIVLQAVSTAPAIAWGFAGGLLALLITLVGYLSTGYPSANRDTDSARALPEAIRAEEQSPALKLAGDHSKNDSGNNPEHESEFGTQPEVMNAALESRLLSEGEPVDAIPTVQTDEDTTFWMTRKQVDEDGILGEVIEGSVRVVLVAGQKTTSVHLPISPALPAIPVIECDVTNADGIRIKVGEVRTFGVRFDLRRTSAAEDVSAEVGFMLFATPGDETPASSDAG